MKLKRKLRNIAIAIVAIIALLAVYIYIIGRDIAPADFSDLALPTVHIAPEENAYTYFSKAAETLGNLHTDDQRREYLHDNRTNMTIIAEVLSDYEEIFKYIQQGIQYQECIFPVATKVSTVSTIPHRLHV